ncbi:transcriptional regulator [Bradyrhizobium sp. BR 10289]|uniref:transcriptional regulator n=1 Tax=Bradyrhizobium sp. BR 10289 TaxID=2749993 RepID=UPI001C6479AA|nr:transcriptional regulator [Bradyrhizobium sp. BR 10289]MBW7973615.1 transcriptional regulator [Bradyrhizobium sp. BR 10289]
MSASKSAGPSPESIARAARQRLAAEEGVRAIADVERQGVELRKNMARLRELREAKEAADAAIAATLPPPAPKKRARKPSR